MNIGTVIKEKREEKGLTQQELADMVFVTRQTVSRWETGVSYPNLDTLIQLQEIFGFSIDDVIRKETGMVKSISRDVQTKKIYKRLFIILASFIGVILLLIGLLGFGRANQIDIIDRYNPFLIEKVGYANLPTQKSNPIDTFVYDDSFGSGEWLKFDTGMYDGKKDVALVKHKGSYVESVVIISKKNVPEIMRDQISGEYDAYDKEIYGPRVNKLNPWNPFN